MFTVCKSYDLNWVFYDLPDQTTKLPHYQTVRSCDIPIKVNRIDLFNGKIFKIVKGLEPVFFRIVSTLEVAISVLLSECESIITMNVNPISVLSFIYK